MRLPRFASTLAFRISGIFLLLLSCIGGGFLWWLNSATISGDIAEEEQFWYTETAEVEMDALALELAASFQDPDELTRQTVAYGRDINRYEAEVLVFDDQGQQLTSSNPDSLSLAVPVVNAQLLHDMSSGDWDYDSYPLPDDVDAYENRIFEVDRLHQGADPDQPVIGYLAASYRPLTLSLDDIESAERQIGLKAIALLLLYSAISGLVIMAWTTRRIQRLSESVDAFASGKLQTRVTDNSKDEIGSLGRHFNTMAHNLENSMDKLKDKEQFQRQLIANISHDLRTPMASMRGYIETLSLNAETLSQDDRNRYLGIVTGNLLHLDKLIDHMLVLSRFDSGQVAFQMEEFPLVELADSVLMRCEAVAREREVTLDLEVDDNATLVNADPLQIAQVLQNLVENGIKFNKPQGRVVIQISGSENLVRVSVKDTGMGIAQEDLPHIFKRFFTADKSRTRAVDGSGMAAVQDHLGQSSGLGLAIASKIVAGHNSMLQVESHLGEGTVFSFSLKAGGEDFANLAENR